VPRQVKPAAKSKARARLRLAILPVMVAVALLIAWRLGYFNLDERDRLLGSIERARGMTWTMPLYVVAYVFVVLLGLPATVFSVLGGALFGAWRGLLLAWTGAMLGTAAAYVLARSVAKAPVKRLFGNHRLLRKLRARGDVLGLMRLRVLPVAPFGVLDYVAAIAGVPLGTLLIATGLGILPGMAAYTYVGHQVVTGIARGDGAREALLIAVGVTVVMTTISVAPSVIERLRHEDED
jgi:uncharacterized membrane protein YdjX (TVP38/TMEM64 family)